MIGASTAFVGLAIRAWAAGHLVKNDRLSSWGPYSFTRNPLYFGSFLLALGFAIAGHWGFVPFVILLFVLIYLPTMRHERDQLAIRYGATYDEYARNVPMFFPRLLPWKGGVSGGAGEPSFDRELYARHREWQAALGYLAGVAFLIWRLSSA
ncbi:MAG: methyltransferase family protein [Gemmatimonadota bacterium]